LPSENPLKIQHLYPKLELQHLG